MQRTGDRTDISAQSVTYRLVNRAISRWAGELRRRNRTATARLGGPARASPPSPGADPFGRTARSPVAVRDREDRLPAGPQASRPLALPSTGSLHRPPWIGPQFAASAREATSGLADGSPQLVDMPGSVEAVTSHADNLSAVADVVSATTLRPYWPAWSPACPTLRRRRGAAPTRSARRSQTTPRRRRRRTRRAAPLFDDAHRPAGLGKAPREALVLTWRDDNQLAARRSEATDLAVMRAVGASGGHRPRSRRRSRRAPRRSKKRRRAARFPRRCSLPSLNSPARQGAG